MTELGRRAAVTLGAATLLAGPAALAANAVAAAAEFGPGYVWRWARWGRRENQANAEFFDRRTIPASPTPRPLPRALDPAVVRAEAEAGLGPGWLGRTGTTAWLLLRDGVVVREEYAPGLGAGTLLGSRSMAKSVVAMLAMAAIAQRRLPGLDSPVGRLLPDAAGLRDSPATLGDVMRMAGGLRFRGEPPPLGPFADAGLWDPATVAYFVPRLRAYLLTARPGDPPGTRFRYDDRAAQLVGLVLERALAAPVSTTLHQLLWAPLGAEHHAEWALNGTDGLEKLEGGLFATAPDWARLGLCVLRGGEGVLPPGAVAAMTAPLAEAPPGYFGGFREFAAVPGLGYGLFWWTLPEGDCFMSGLYGQVVYVCRRRRLVAVRTGSGSGGVAHWPSLIRRVCTAAA